MIIQADYPDNWKLDALVRLTGTEGAVRCHLRLLAHCQKSQRWQFTLSAFQLANICRWAGEPAKWFMALEQVGLIDVEMGSADEGMVSWQVHDFKQHNPRMCENWTKNLSGKSGSKASPSRPHEDPNRTPIQFPRPAQADPTKTPTEPQQAALGVPIDPRMDGRMEGRKDGGMDGILPPPRGGKKRFLPPSLLEWVAEAAQAGWKSPSDVKAAFHSYEAKGWKVGKSPMVDWRAAVRTCFARWQGDGSSTQKTNPPPHSTPGDASAFATASAAESISPQPENSTQDEEDES